MSSTKLFVLLAGFLSFSSYASLEQCISEICGPASENDNYLEYQSKFTAVDKNKHKEYQERLTNVILKNKNAMVELEYKNIESMQGIDLELIRSFPVADQVFILLLRKIFPAISILARNGHLAPSLLNNIYIEDMDYTKLLIENGIKEKEASWLNSIFRSIKNEYAINKIAGIIISQAPEYAITSYTQNYGSTNFKNIHEQANKIMFNITNNQSQSHLLSTMLYYIEDILKSSNLDANKIQSINTAFALNELATMINKKESSEFIKLMTNNTEELMVDIINNIRSESESYKHLTSMTSQEIEKRLNKATSECVNRTLLTINQLPTKKEIDQMADYIRLVKRKATEFTRQRVSYSYAKSIDKRLDKIQVDVPLTVNDFKRDVIVDIERMANTNLTHKQSVALALIGSNTNYYESEFFPFERAVENCKPINDFGLLYDYAITEEIIEIPSMKVSWSVLKNLDRFKSVIAHEIGHHLFIMLRGSVSKHKKHSDLSFNNVKEIVECTASLHGKKDKEYYSLWDKNGDHNKVMISKYTSEDFADQFSAFVDQDNSHNMACVFALQENNTYKDLSLVNSDPKDVHSSPAYRVINIEYSKKGKLPTSCSQALINANLEMKSCLAHQE